MSQLARLRDYMSKEAKAEYDETFAQLTPDPRATVAKLRRIHDKESLAEREYPEVPDSAYTSKDERTEHQIWPPGAFETFLRAPVIRPARTEKS